jgi:uncharacterized protein (DUF2147 family)
MGVAEVISKKAAGVTLLIAAIGLGTSALAVAAGPYDQPPQISIVGKAKLKKGKVKVAVATCGTGTCSVASANAKIKAPGASFKGKFTGGSLGPIAAGQSIAIKVKVPKSARGLSKEKVKVGLTISSDVGLSASASGKTKVK